MKTSQTEFKMTPIVQQPLSSISNTCFVTSKHLILSPRIDFVLYWLIMDLILGLKWVCFETKQYEGSTYSKQGKDLEKKEKQTLKVSFL